MLQLYNSMAYITISHPKQFIKIMILNYAKVLSDIHAARNNTINSIYLKLTCCLMSSHRLMPHSCLQLLWHQYIAVTVGPTA